MVACLVDANPVQPGVELGAKIERADRLIRLHKRLLGDIVRLIIVIDQMVDDIKEPRGVLFEQESKALAISPFYLFD